MPSTTKPTHEQAQLHLQVYDLRRQLRRMCDALAVQPPEVQAAVRRALPPLAGQNGERD